MNFAVASFASFRSSEAVCEGSADGIIEKKNRMMIESGRPRTSKSTYKTAGHLVHSNDTDRITTDQTYCTEIMTTQQHHSSID